MFKGVIYMKKQNPKSATTIGQYIGGALLTIGFVGVFFWAIKYWFAMFTGKRDVTELLPFGFWWVKLGKPRPFIFIIIAILFIVGWLISKNKRSKNKS